MSRIRDEIRRDADKDPAQIEREIDVTRAELRATLEALEDRFSPSHLIDDAMSQVRRHSGEFAGNLGSSIKENPVPALLASVGIAWMMASNGRHHDGDGAHRVRGRQRLHDVRDRVRSAKESMQHRSETARGKLSSSASTVRSRASGMSSAARRQAGHARELLHEQPLVLGALGLAAGVIAGAMMPPTDYEDEHIGPMRDRALERAKTKGADGVRRASERAREATEHAREEMQRSGNGRGGNGEHRETASTTSTPTTPPPV